MKNTRTLVCWAYGLVATAALAITWSQYLPVPDGGLPGFWAQMKVNHVARGVTVDLAFFLLAAALFMVSEARRLSIRFVWLYLLLGYLVDISVAFPIFMIMRERAMARASEEDAGLAITDLIAILATVGVIVWQTGFVLS
jgi:hypothetical protein